MSYLHLFSPNNLALLHDWLEETGELYVDVDLPHSGSSGSAYRVRSINDLKDLISRQTHPEIVFAIFHSLQYPIRGVADETLLKQALQQIPDGAWYTIIQLESVYPSSVVWRGNGKSQEELRRDFADVLGERVGIGINPADVCSDWRQLSSEEVLTLSVLRNQNYYEPYVKNPDKYKSVFDLWQE